MCVLSTLCGNVDKHSPFDIYIYIYIDIVSACPDIHTKVESLAALFALIQCLNYGQENC